jgi:hypothetical protein
MKEKSSLKRMVIVVNNQGRLNDDSRDRRDFTGLFGSYFA